MNILLNVFTDELKKGDFELYSEPYLSEGFQVYNFQYPLSGYYLDMISTLLKYLSSEHNIIPYESRIVIQSNISNLLIAWYRLYNDVIDDFVLIDEHTTHFKSKNPEEQLFIDLLSSFAAMEQEACHDRFYYRCTWPVSLEVLKPFIEGYQYDLLKPFAELELKKAYKKRKIEKQYHFKKWSYKRVTAEERIHQSIDLTKQKEFQSSIELNDIQKPTGFYFVFHYILNLSIEDIEKAKAVTLLNQHMTEECKKEVTKYVHNYLEAMEDKLTFRQVINFYSFLVMMGKDKFAMKKMLKYIKRDSDHLDDHYAPFTNALFYVTKANQEEYGDYFLDRREIMRNLKEFYMHQLTVNSSRSENHLVIITGQMLNYNHSPTKVVINYANNLVKYNPEIKIKIIVEDMFNYSPNELFFVHPFVSESSKSIAEEHKRLLHPNIKLHYSNSKLPRGRRLQEDIHAIIDFKPQWILKMGAPDSLVGDQLFDYFPVVSISMGDVEYSDFMDIQLYGYSFEDALVEGQKRGIKLDRKKYEQHVPGLQFPKGNHTFSRGVFGWDENDFIIITVGNRLDAEMDLTFVEGIAKLLSKHKQFQWLIVGASKHILVNSVCKNVIEQVKFIPYVENLMDVYPICDIYANPFRKGGGISIAMAMDAGLPVANLEGNNDGNGYVPEGKALSFNDYFRYIEEISIDKEISITESMLFQKHLQETFGFEQAIKHLKNILENAERKFFIRSK